MWLFFFFQAEDGIRDDLVTGVQTCALLLAVDEQLLASQCFVDNSGNVMPLTIVYFCRADDFRSAVEMARIVDGHEAGGAVVQPNGNVHLTAVVTVALSQHVGKSVGTGRFHPGVQAETTGESKIAAVRKRDA